MNTSKLCFTRIQEKNIIAYLKNFLISFQVKSDLFQKFVQIGSVAFINYGPHHGKLVVIVDIIDSNRVRTNSFFYLLFQAIVSDPKGTLDRQTINLDWIQLTKYRLPIARGQHLKTIRQAFEKAEVAKKFAESHWGKKIANGEKKASLKDFDRFSQRIQKQKVHSYLITLLNTIKEKSETKNLCLQGKTCPQRWFEGKGCRGQESSKKITNFVIDVLIKMRSIISNG